MIFSKNRENCLPLNRTHRQIRRTSCRPFQSAESDAPDKPHPLTRVARLRDACICRSMPDQGDHRHGYPRTIPRQNNLFRSNRTVNPEYSRRNSIAAANGWNPSHSSAIRSSVMSTRRFEYQLDASSARIARRSAIYFPPGTQVEQFPHGGTTVPWFVLTVTTARFPTRLLHESLPRRPPLRHSS